MINEGDYSPNGLTYTMVDVYVREPTRSYAEYGQATWAFLPDTHLTLGVRNTDDTKSIGGNTLVDGFDAVHGRQTADFSKVTYRAVLDRQFTPDILGYVSWNTGFKSGQYSLVNFTEPPRSVLGTSLEGANALFCAISSFSRSSSDSPSRACSSSSRAGTRAPPCDRSPSRERRTLVLAHSDQ